MAIFMRFVAIRVLNHNLVKTISTKNSESLVSCAHTRSLSFSQPSQAKSDGTGSTSINPTKTGSQNESDDDKPKNWISWGAHETDEWWDRFIVHSTLFMGVSVCIVGCGTFIAYMPDPKQREWTQREAFLRLRYRETNGLPLVNPNLLDPSEIKLPTDEELGDTEIIL